MTDEGLAPDAILSLGYAFIGSKVLLSAVEVGVFSALAPGPLDAERLRAWLGLHERGARDLFDVLVAMGMLRRDAAGRYANTPETDHYLDRAKPSYIGTALELANARSYGTWSSLTVALRTGERQDGSDGNGRAPGYPLDLKHYLRAMTALSRRYARHIADRFPWDRYRTFADIGTAEGDLPVQVLRAHPHLAGSAFDVPDVEPIFEEYVAATGLGDRLRFIPGNFFVDPLPEADALVMAHVLHDWNLEEKRLLLTKAYQALPPGGALIICEKLIDDERRQNLSGLLSNLNLLLDSPGGREFTVSEGRSWLSDVGFRTIDIERIDAFESLMVGIK